MSFNRRSKQSSNKQPPVNRRKQNPKLLRSATGAPMTPPNVTERISRREQAVAPARKPLQPIMPRVTVVMAVRQAPASLERCLAAIFAQDYPAHRMEVFVADATTARNLSARLSALQNGHSNVQVIMAPANTIPSGLNAALRAASGEYIVRVDASAIIEPDFVRQCVENLRNTGTDNVTGKMAIARTGFFAKPLSAATKSRFGIGGGMFPYYNEETRLFSFCGEEPRADAVYLSAWRRDLFAQIGLFDEGLGRNQDDSINCRLLENRGRVMLSSEIKSTFETRTTLGSILKNYFEFGMWKVRLMQRHPWHIVMRQFASPVLVGMWLLLAVVACVTSFGVSLFAGFTGLLLAANFAASLLTARRCGLKQLPKLCITFAAMHVGYGLGVLTGLVRFAGRWNDRGQYEKLSVATTVAEQFSAASISELAHVAM